MPPNDIFRPQEVMGASVEELAEAQEGLQQLILAASPRGGLRAEMVLALGQLHRYAVSIIHVVTGRLKNSLFWETEQRGNDLLGHVATNVDYALAEENRGGSHAFATRTVREEGPNVANDLIGGFVVRAGLG